jgi:hypothetical protein
MANKEPGYVYILTNPSFREDWVKIGKTTNMEERLRTLYNTSLPLPFEVFATMKTSKYNEAEKLVHHYIERFTNLRIEKKREFFNVKPEEALEIFREVASLLDDAEIDEVYMNGTKGGNTKEDDSEPAPRKTRNTQQASENKVWLIPYNKKFFNLKGCFDKFGEVYWTQHCRFQAGDTGYIYGSAPESAIRFSFKIVEADLPYDPKMDQDNEFVKSNGPTNSDYNGKLYAHMILTGEANTKRLSLANLIDRGLKAAPMGALNLSKKEMKDLLVYINENF